MRMTSDQESAEAESVAIHIDAARVVRSAIAIGCIALALLGVATLLPPGHAGLAVAALILGLPCLFHALFRLFNLNRLRAFFPSSREARAYIGFDRAVLHLLGEVEIPWSSIESLKISRLTWPRRTYLLVGLKPPHRLGDAGTAIPPSLTADNLLIALALREATGAVLEPHTFLAVCIEANWSWLAPIALTRSARQIADLAADFFHQQSSVTDRVEAAALFSSAQLAYRSGDWAQAQETCRRVLALDGEHDEALFMMSLVALAGGARSDAENHLRQALALREHPAYADKLGMLLQQTGRVEEAESWLRRALALAPDDVSMMCNLANLLKDTGRVTEAEALYRRIIELDPSGTPGLNNLGILLWKQGRLAEAADCLQRTLALDPALADAHSNLGIVQKELAQYDEAESSYRRALELKPQSAHTYNNLGLLYQEINRQQEAQRAFERALELQPDYGPARYNLSLTRLAQEDYARGLPDLEARFDPTSPDAPVKLPPLPFPQWRGEDLNGKTLVVWPEQGLGDIIQFARYFPLLKQRGLARLTVCCTAVLAPLLQSAEGVDAIVSEQAELAAQDYWTFPMSLALRCDTQNGAVPAALPYLHALPERVQRWQPELETRKRKVGLVWKGAAGHKNDTNRSLPSLGVLEPLWHAADVQFFSLQKGQGEDQAEAAAASGRLLHLGGRIADLGDTAAIVAQLDLVICVDTAIAHVAGALGKRCWVLLPAIGCDWRWHLERTDSPWYPGVMRLFRQRQAGDWSEVVADVAQALQALMEEAATSG